MKKLYYTLLFACCIHTSVWAQLDITASSYTLSTAAQNGCGSATELITIEIVNVGTVSTPSVFAAFSIDGGAQIGGPESVGAMLVGDTITYIFTATADLSAPGPHSLVIGATTLNDANTSNDSLFATVNTGVTLIPSLPVVDFTGFTGGNLSAIFAGWSEGEGIGVPSGISSSWNSDDFANDGMNANGTAARINLWSVGNDDWLISPQFTATSNTSLVFDLAVTVFDDVFATAMGSDDMLQVMVSTDCGASYTPISTYDFGSSISNTGQVDTLSLNAYAGMDISIAFFATEGIVDDIEDYDIFLDNINIVEVLAINGAATSISTSVAATAGCGSTTDSVSIVVENIGTNSLSGIMASFSVDGGAYGAAESISGSLAPNNTLSYTFAATADLSAVGVHTIEGAISVSGDGDTANDTIATTVTTNPVLSPTLPVVDFTGFSGSNLGAIAAGWSEGTGIGSPSGTSSDWDNDIWVNTGTSYGTSARINLWDVGTNDWMISPRFSVSANTELSYDLGMTVFSSTAPSSLGTDDVVQVLVSADCGASYSPLITYNSASVISSTGQNEVLSLAAYAGQDVSIAFYASEGLIDDTSDVDVFIDNINIKELFPIDLEMLAITEPASAACFFDPLTISVDITNEGTNQLDFASNPTTFTVDVAGANVGTYTVTLSSGTLASGMNMDVLVTSTADLSAVGFNTLTASLSSSADPNPNNDSISRFVESLPIVPMPFSEDFEGFSVGIPGGLVSGWTRELTGPLGLGWYVNDAGTPSSGTGPTGNHTPGGSVYMFTEVTDGLPGDEYSLYTPCIGLTGVSNAALSFYYHMHGIDIGTLEVDVIRPFVDTTTIFSLMGQQQVNQGDAWNNAITDMSSYVGDTIQLCFRGIRGADFRGDIAIDDIEIIELATDDLAVSTILSPLGNGRDLTSTALGSASPVTIEIINNGFNDASNFEVEYWLNGMLIDTDIITNTLANSAVMTHTFGTPVDLSAVGIYDIVVVTKLIGDVSPSNDTMAIRVRQLANPALTLPFMEGFEFTDSLIASEPFIGLEGADRFDFEYSEPDGRLRTAAGTGFYKGGMRAITLDRNPTGGIMTNYLIATLNMSNYSTSDSIVLDFSYMHHGEEAHPNDRVWIRGSDTDTSWVEIFDLNLSQGTAGLYNDISDINLSMALAGAGQAYSTSTQIRFGQEDNFSASSPTGDDGFTFDEITVRKFLDNDVAAESVIIPNVNCGDSLTMGTVEIRNSGLLTQSGIPVTVIVTNPMGVSDTFQLSSATLAYNERDSLMFGPINTVLGGGYSVIAIMQLAGDGNLMNDTTSAILSFRSIFPPEALAVEDVCAGESIEVYAVSETGVSMEWYDAPVGGALLGIGDTFMTDPLVGDTSFFLAAGNTEGAASVGPKDNVFGSGGVFAFFQEGLVFDALMDFRLSSVTIYPIGPGNAVVRLLDSAGSILEVDTFSIPAGMTEMELLLDWDISSGVGYQIDADSSTVISLYRNNGGAMYPYELPGVVSITGPINELPGFYYFFYDWKVNGPDPCRPVRTEVSLRVLPLAVADFDFVYAGGSTVNFTSLAMNADSVLFDFGGGNTSNDLNPIFDFGANGEFVVSMIAYNSCGTDTISDTLSIVGLEELIDLASLEIYPNPTHGDFTLSLTKLRRGDMVVELIGMNGQQVYSKSFEGIQGDFKHRFDLPPVASGIYLVKVLIEGEMTFLKLQID